MKKALVTGASSGIGAVYADRLAKQGYDLILIARDETRLNAVASRIKKETGRGVETHLLDLSVKANIVKIEKIIELDAALSMIVNNAGYSGNGSFLEADGDSIEDMITVNITALARLSNAAAKVFAKKKSGIIVNIGSGVVLIPDQFNGVYGGTKAFILNFTRNIAEQLKSHGITVQVVLPGAILTEAFKRAGDKVSHVPKEAIMSTEDLVDSALAGLEQKEVVTIPSLENAEAWTKFEEARLEMIPQIFNGKPASRYF
jgi:short-subunit dehydrogenase